MTKSGPCEQMAPPPAFQASFFCFYQGFFIRSKKNEKGGKTRYWHADRHTNEPISDDFRLWGFCQAYSSRAELRRILVLTSFSTRFGKFNKWITIRTKIIYFLTNFGTNYSIRKPICSSRRDLPIYCRVEKDSNTLQYICYSSTIIKENFLIFQISTVQSLKCINLKDEEIIIKNEGLDSYLQNLLTFK